MVKEAPKPIRIAVSRLSGVPGVTLDSSPEYVPEESSWAVRLRLTCMHPSCFVPEETRWIALVDESYPAGHIRLFPSQDGGILHTFPHQDRNVVSSSSYPAWRTGKPCLDSPSQRLGRVAGGPEPKGDAEERLRWHVERCLGWLELAAEDQLMSHDEPFEAPQSPAELIDTRVTVIHDEGSDTWSAWNGHVGCYGEIHWGVLPGFEKTIVADEFFDARGERIRGSRRGGRSGEQPWAGYWWLWPSPIVIPPWHAPGTWGDLRRIGKRLQLDVETFLRWISRRARSQKGGIALLGYPIPTLWNGAPVEVYWQAIDVPKVPREIRPMDGFRDNERGLNERLRREIFSGSKRLSYLKTENWHPERLQARGRLPAEVRARSVAVIGVGALGSSVAELLARGGVAEILVIDGDDLEAGNLARHTLTGVALGKNKATAVAARLQGVAPMSRIISSEMWLPQGDELRTLLEPFDVVLDCTGEDEVLRDLGAAWWSVPRRFLSASLGFAASRLFLFGVYACRFPFEEFEGAVGPWLEEERFQWTANGETIEGAGCWSPLFPARSDDVWLAAVATVKYLERVVREEVADGLHVLEQRSDEFVLSYKPVALKERM